MISLALTHGWWVESNWSAISCGLPMIISDIGNLSRFLISCLCCLVSCSQRFFKYYEYERKWWRFSPETHRVHTNLDIYAFIFEHKNKRRQHC
jgi:hypothetical protein